MLRQTILFLTQARLCYQQILFNELRRFLSVFQQLIFISGIHIHAPFLLDLNLKYGRFNYWVGRGVFGNLLLSVQAIYQEKFIR